MKNKKSAIWMFLLLLVLGLTVMGKPVEAASYRQIAYINSGEKRLVLKFSQFSKTGYTWKVTEAGVATPIVTGTLKGGKIGSSKAMKVDLAGKYKTKTKYTLTVTGKDNKKSITVKYYSGTDLVKSALTTTNNDELKATSTVSGSFQGTCGELLVFKGDDSTSLLSSVKLTKTGKSGSNFLLSGVILPSRLANGQYKTYTILNYSMDGTTYYGQGTAANYKFMKKVGKVSNIRLSTANSRVKITWTAAKNASYYKIYQSTSKNGKYKCVAKKVKTTSYSRQVKGAKTYYYKIAAMGEAGSKKISGGKSNIVSIQVAKVPGKVTGVKFSYDFDQNLVIRWSKSINTTGYILYYKKSTDKKYTKLGSTKNRVFRLSKLNGNTTYNIYIQAYRKSGSDTVKSSGSTVLTINPNAYIKANKQLLLANSVRTIEHINGTRSIYTSKHYSAETKLAFANVKGYSSNTNYLIWISHYTQQVTIFKGSKGKWKIIRTFICGSGKASTPSPIGVFKTTYKETGWYYTSTKELYVTHYCGRNSFHTRPLYNDGSVCTATIGRPVSHGCARLYNEDAKFIYDNIPNGTTVVSY